MKIHNVTKAKELLQKGQIVAIPTETVYGLAGLINNPKAVESIFLTKERPFFDPLIVHVHSEEQASEYTKNWGELHSLLAKNFWPGPLTIICKKDQDKVSDMITAGLNTVGVRCPSHPLALELLKSLKSPFAAPSANKFTKTSPTNADHVLESFDGKVPVLEGDYCDVGLESTIVEIDEKKMVVNILRPGMITQTQLQKTMPAPYIVKFANKSQVPGSMKKHYAPEIPFYFIPEEKEEFIDQIIVSSDQDLEKYEFQLSKHSQLAARELYSKLRDLKKLKDKGLAYFVMREHHKEISWIPIIDKLRRAAG